jgi:hypothetical protein
MSQALRAVGAGVVEVATHQCAPPAHADLLRRLGDQIGGGQVDAVAFTNAATGDYLLVQATADHRLDEVLNALSEDVPAMGLGLDPDGGQAGLPPGRLIPGSAAAPPGAGARREEAGGGKKRAG